MKKKEGQGGEFLAEIARSYYILGHSQDAIASKLHLKQSTVSILLEKAREHGVVYFDIDPEFADCGIEDLLRSRDLRDEFSLKDAFVVDVPEQEAVWNERGDRLHTFIANTAATVKLKTWIVTGDHVVIGGGRAPVRAARMLKRISPTSRDVRISPLSGRIWIGSWQEDSTDILERPLDSDDAARLLAAAFEHEPGTRFSQIGLPLYQDAEHIEQILEHECVFGRGGKWNWDLRPPDKALVGVGVLQWGSGHRIPALLNMYSRRGREDSSGNAVFSVAKKFEEAMKYAEDSQLPHFCDVANRLFPALPLPSEIAANSAHPGRLDKSYRTLCSLIDDLNAHAVVAEWKHLRPIGSVWAIAGGRLKRNALWTLLITRRFESCLRTGQGA